MRGFAVDFEMALKQVRQRSQSNEAEQRQRQDSCYLAAIVVSRQIAGGGAEVIKVVDTNMTGDGSLYTMFTNV